MKGGEGRKEQTPNRAPPGGEQSEHYPRPLRRSPQFSGTKGRSSQGSFSVLPVPNFSELSLLEGRNIETQRREVTCPSSHSKCLMITKMPVIHLL
jgi:hypothetical protein